VSERVRILEHGIVLLDFSGIAEPVLPAGD